MSNETISLIIVFLLSNVISLGFGLCLALGVGVRLNLFTIEEFGNALTEANSKKDSGDKDAK